MNFTNIVTQLTKNGVKQIIDQSKKKYIFQLIELKPVLREGQQINEKTLYLGRASDGYLYTKVYFNQSQSLKIYNQKIKEKDVVYIFDYEIKQARDCKIILVKGIQTIYTNINDNIGKPLTFKEFQQMNFQRQETNLNEISLAHRQHFDKDGILLYKNNNSNRNSQISQLNNSSSNVQFNNQINNFQTANQVQNQQQQQQQQNNAFQQIQQNNVERSREYEQNWKVSHDMENFTVQNLSIGMSNFEVIGKVSFKTKVLQKNNGDQYFYCKIIDTDGCEIQLYFYGTHVSNLWHDDLWKDNTYGFQNFRCQPSYMQRSQLELKWVKDQSAIRRIEERQNFNSSNDQKFQCDNEVYNPQMQQQQEDGDNEGQNRQWDKYKRFQDISLCQKFKFVPITKIKLENQKNFVNVIGIVIDVMKETQTRTANNDYVQRKIIKLADEGMESIEFALWGKQIQQHEFQRKDIVVITDAVIKPYFDKANITTKMNFTNIITARNPYNGFKNIDRHKQLENFIRQNPNFETQISGHRVNPNKQVQFPTKTIKEIKDLNENLREGQIREYDLECHIKYFKNIQETRCYYLACPKCNRKVLSNGQEYQCNSCFYTTKNPNEKFILEMRVEDSSGDIWLFMPDPVASDILQFTASHFCQLINEDKRQEAEDLFNKKINKEFLFRIQVKRDNYNGVSQLNFKVLFQYQVAQKNIIESNLSEINKLVEELGM